MTQRKLTPAEKKEAAESIARNYPSLDMKRALFPHIINDGVMVVSGDSNENENYNNHDDDEEVDGGVIMVVQHQNGSKSWISMLLNFLALAVSFDYFMRYQQNPDVFFDALKFLIGVRLFFEAIKYTLKAVWFLMRMFKKFLIYSAISSFRALWFMLGVMKKVFILFVLPVSAAIVVSFIFFSAVHRDANAIDKIKEVVGSGGKDLSTGIVDLPAHYFKEYTAGPFCLKGKNKDSIIRAIDNELKSKDVPHKVRTSIINSLEITDETSFVNSFRDTEIDNENNGFTTSYVGHTSLLFNEIFRTYETCVIVGGINFQAEKVISHYETSTKKIKIGTERVNCSFLGLFCEVKPIFTDEITRFPIFKTHVLKVSQLSDMTSYLETKITNRINNISTSQEPMLIEKAAKESNVIISGLLGLSN